MAAKLAIIILNWNAYDLTAACLASLRAVSYPDKRIIVVDNGSIDGSPERLVRDFPEIALLRAPRNLGFTGGNNLALRATFAEPFDYFLLLNNDTVVAPDCLEPLVAALEEEPDIGIACPKIYYFEPADVLWYAGGNASPRFVEGELVGRKQRDRGQFDAPRDVTFASGCAMLIRRALIERIGYLDDNIFIYAEDGDYSLRAVAAGFRIRYVPASRIWHKEGFATKRNAGQAFRVYYGTRGILWVTRKHARPLDWIVFLPRFVLLWMGRFSLLALKRRRPEEVIAMARAVADFWRMSRGRPPRWGEPKQLAPATHGGPAVAGARGMA